MDSGAAAGANLLAATSEASVQARFTTPQRQFAVTETPFSVPLSLRRAGLSAIINHLLGQEKPVPFDFIVDGKFVRSTLEAHIAECELSMETVITVEYLQALPPPRPEQSMEHDDWVAAIDASRSGRLVSGCYDGIVRIWDESGACQEMLEGHLEPVKAVKWGATVDVENGAPAHSCLSASQDCTARLWSNVNADDGTETDWHCQSVFEGHTGAIDTMSLHPDANEQMFCTGSWDESIKLWSYTDDSTSEEGSAKRQKTSKRRGKKTRQGPSTVSARATIVGHRGAVSGVEWAAGGQVIVSGGWDSTLRVWSVESGVNVQRADTACAVTALAVNAQNSLTAAGHCDGVTRLYDLRMGTTPQALSADANVLVKCALAPPQSSHRPAFVQCVQWAPSHHNQPYLLATALFRDSDADSVVHLWDIRGTNRPLHSIKDHTKKVFALAWADDAMLFSGGEDHKILSHSFAK